MAGKTGTTALQTAIQGGKVSDKAARTALGTAVDRIANLTRRAQHGREAMVETGTLALHTAETQGTVFLASMAEGYLGEDRLKVGGVDLRAPAGLAATGYGLYQTLNGNKNAGSHVLAIGNGLMGSWLANQGRNVGRALSERRTPEPPPTATLTPSAPVQLQGLLPPPPPLVAGPPREVLLTPAELAEGEEVGRGGRGRGGRGGGRMRHRMRERRQERQEEDDEAVSGEPRPRRRRFRDDEDE